MWANYSITLEEAKNFFKVEHNLEDDLIIDFVQSAIETAAAETNREFETVPASIKLAILQTALYWYENRTDTDTIPAPAARTFQKHYRFPGL